MVRIAAWASVHSPNGKPHYDHDIIDPAIVLIWELILVQTADREVRSDGTFGAAAQGGSGL
jgi:hypothetical protein